MLPSMLSLLLLAFSAISTTATTNATNCDMDSVKQCVMAATSCPPRAGIMDSACVCPRLSVALPCYASCTSDAIFQGAQDLCGKKSDACAIAGIAACVNNATACKMPNDNLAKCLCPALTPKVTATCFTECPNSPMIAAATSFCSSMANSNGSSVMNPAGPSISGPSRQPNISVNTSTSTNTSNSSCSDNTATTCVKNAFTCAPGSNGGPDSSCICPKMPAIDACYTGCQSLASYKYIQQVCAGFKSGGGASVAVYSLAPMLSALFLSSFFLLSS